MMFMVPVGLVTGPMSPTYVSFTQFSLTTDATSLTLDDSYSTTTSGNVEISQGGSTMDAGVVEDHSQHRLAAGADRLA
jgi:lipopolysaccharide export system protein LptA